MSCLEEEDDNGLVEESIQLERRMTMISCLINPPRSDIRLPEEIMLNILSRLPAESVLECRRVCKTWRNLPLLHDNNTYFADMHLGRHQSQQHGKEFRHHNNSNYNTMLSFVFLGISPYKSLYYVESNENDMQSYITQKRMTLPIPAYIEYLVGSCNGLICLSGKWKYDPSIYICNPITREFVYLPRNIIDTKHEYRTIAQGFGYHPSTKEYKVVRVYYCADHQIELVYVYTLGNDIGWRNKGELTTIHPYKGYILRFAVFLNGVLYWQSSIRNIILAFDLADEKFHCLPVPPYYSHQILTLDRWLCVVHHEIGGDTEIWLLKNKNEEKQATSCNNEDIEVKEYQSWSWNQEFTIRIKHIYPLYNYEPFAITKRASGEILIFYKGMSIHCYDSKTPAMRKDLGDLDEAIIDSHGIPHFNSFVSLKALGENAEIL